jgi:hypothetical protein
MSVCYANRLVLSLTPPCTEASYLCHFILYKLDDIPRVATKMKDMKICIT